MYRVMKTEGDKMELVGYYRKFPLVASAVGVSSVTLRNWFARQKGANYYRKGYEVSMFWLVEKEVWVNSSGQVLKRPKNSVLKAHNAIAAKVSKNIKKEGDREIDYDAYPNDTRFEK